MNADGRIEVWVSRAHDCRRGTASRQAGDIHTPRPDPEVAHDLAGDARDQRGLALITLLIARVEPVPALGDIGRHVLRRISHEERLLFSEIVHPRTERKVVWRLGAAVQHHHKGERLPVVTARNIELVRPASCFIGIVTLFKLRALWHQGPECGPPRARPIRRTRALRRDPLNGRGSGEARQGPAAYSCPRDDRCSAPPELR